MSIKYLGLLLFFAGCVTVKVPEGLKEPGVIHKRTTECFNEPYPSNAIIQTRADEECQNVQVSWETRATDISGVYEGVQYQWQDYPCWAYTLQFSCVHK
jgi:hypothetical protein